MIQDLHSMLLDKLFEGVYYVDTKRRIVFWNQAAEKLTGFSKDEIVGSACYNALLKHVSPDGVLLCEEGCPLHATLQDGEIREVELYLHHKEGHRVPVVVRITPIYDEEGNISGAMEMFHHAGHEIAQRNRISELEQLAYIDPLTELANRRFATYRIESRLEELKRYGWPFGVLYADIDHFKSINDTHGHDVGDSVLKMVAMTLEAASRSFDLVARYGGEEFVVIVTNVDRPRLREVGERFRLLVSTTHLREPANIGVTISVGAALARPDDTVESLVKRADERLYEAKNRGRNSVCG